jgi:hypothetical protein
MRQPGKRTGVEEEGGGGGIIEEIVAAITSILAPSVYLAIFQRVWKYRLKCLPYQLVSLFVVRHTTTIIVGFVRVMVQFHGNGTLASNLKD